MNRFEEKLRDFTKTYFKNIKPETSCLSDMDFVMYYEGLLPKLKREKVEKHLSECSKCLNEYIDFANFLKEEEEMKDKKFPSLPKRKFKEIIKVVRNNVSKEEKNILISCLGLAPAVITEMLLALKNKKININKVLAISTADKRILNSCYPLLRESINRKFPKTEFDLIYTPSPDIKTQEDNFEFMLLSAKTILHYKALGYKVYLSLAGGRKTMSNIIGTIAQFFGAEGLYHILVPDEFEREGRIENFKDLAPEEIDKKLYPEKFELVEIPFVGISSLIEVIKKIAEDRKVPKEVKNLLLENYLIEKKGEEIILSKKGRELFNIIKKLEKYPDLALLSSYEKLNLEKLKCLKCEKLEDYINFLKFSPYVNYIDFEPKIVKNLENVIIEDLEIDKSGFGEVILKINGEILYLNIDTTAKDLYQAMLIKNFFKKILH